MKTCLVTLDTPDISFHAAPLQENKVRYARRFGHDFLHATSSDFGPDIPASYGKLLAIQRAFLAGYKKVIWADADVGFTNFTRDIAELSDGEKIAGLAEIDKPQPYICFGLVVIPQSFLPMIELIIDLVNERDVETKHPWEQTYVNEFLKTCPARVKLCTVDEIGSFWSEYKIACVPRPWQPGDLTVHLGLGPWWLRHGAWLAKYAPYIVA